MSCKAAKPAFVGLNQIISNMKTISNNFENPLMAVLCLTYLAGAAASLIAVVLHFV